MKTNLENLVYGTKLKLRQFLHALKTHGDAALASEQSGMDLALAEDLTAYSGDDVCIIDARDELVETQREGQARRAEYAKQMFLTSLSMRGLITEAVASQRWYSVRWFQAQRQQDPDFDLAWHNAMECATDRLKAEAWRRGKEGVDEPVIFKGELCYAADSKTGELKPLTIKKYSDTLLLALLKRYDPGFTERVAVDQTMRVEGGKTVGGLLAGLDTAELNVLLKLTKSPADKNELIEEQENDDNDQKTV